MIAKNFLATHPRKGQPTNFKEKILDKEKIHTIRHNYAHWEKVAKEVNAGTAVLVLKEWIGRPYHSKQLEIMRLEKITVQLLNLLNKNSTNITVVLPLCKRVGTFVTEELLAKNDGLSIEDFNGWFPKEKRTYKEDLAIIHFTDFIYKF